jgi:hypothetical protein
VPVPLNKISMNWKGRPIARFLLVCALLILCVRYAFKVIYLAELEPPAQYNHSYDGVVDERVMSVAEARTLCNSLDASPPSGVACSWVSDGTCHIVLPNDYQAPVSTYRRHEIAHCNGWPANHPHDDTFSLRSLFRAIRDIAADA